MQQLIAIYLCVRPYLRRNHGSDLLDSQGFVFQGLLKDASHDEYVLPPAHNSKNACIYNCYNIEKIIIN